MWIRNIINQWKAYRLNNQADRDEAEEHYHKQAAKERQKQADHHSNAAEAYRLRASRARFIADTLQASSPPSRSELRQESYGADFSHQ